MRTAEQLVSAEVLVCLSSLVSTLAQGSVDSHFAADFAGIVEQAQELAAPIPDYEDAARDAGWIRDDKSFVHPDQPRDYANDWQEICDGYGIEPYDREVFEHWAVSDWLADKLLAHGEKVDKDFAGMCVWARTTTGQAISIDSVVEAIVADLVKEYGK